MKEIRNVKEVVKLLTTNQRLQTANKDLRRQLKRLEHIESHFPYLKEAHRHLKEYYKELLKQTKESELALLRIKRIAASAPSDVGWSELKQITMELGMIDFSYFGEKGVEDDE